MTFSVVQSYIDILVRHKDICSPVDMSHESMDRT